MTSLVKLIYYKKNYEFSFDLLVHVIQITKEEECIGGVMVSVLASSVVDPGFEPQSDQVKDFKIGIRIMCSSGATCLLADCCFSELAL